MVPVFIMVFFWYCTIAPLTEIPAPEPVTDAVLNGTTSQPESSPIVGNFDMVRIVKTFLLILNKISSVQMESDLPGAWAIVVFPPI